MNELKVIIANSCPLFANIEAQKIAHLSASAIPETVFAQFRIQFILNFSFELGL